MSDQVWMCNAKSNTQLVRDFRTSHDKPPPKIFSLDALAETFRKNEMGLPLLAEVFPRKLFQRTSKKFRKSLPPFFHAGFLLLIKKAQDVLTEHDLGNGALHPVDLYQHDQVTPIEGNVAALCIGNQKTTVLLDRSPRMYQIWPREPFYSPPLDVKDDEIFVVLSCLEGPDIWADPAVKNVFFVSDRLGKALIKAGMKKAFSLVRCPIG